MANIFFNVNGQEFKINDPYYDKISKDSHTNVPDLITEALNVFVDIYYQLRKGEVLFADKEGDVQLRFELTIPVPGRIFEPGNNK